MYHPAGFLIDGAGFYRLLEAGTRWLERNAGAINALNVFPVPDGDTGTNMLLTMRAALEEAAQVPAPDAKSAGHVLRAAAHGAVMGARGNSGVILSQIVAGAAHAVGEAPACDGPLLARALVEGADTAYRAVPHPVEGTILTVARAAGEAARAATEADGSNADATTVLQAAADAAQRAVERTPDQLALLRQAGVVDAGGEGYRIILEGMALALRNQPLPEIGGKSAAHAHDGSVPALVVTAPDQPGSANLAAIPSEEWGYCTQFLIRGDKLDLGRIRQELQTLAASALVVGDESLIRVHGHTEDPGQLLSYGSKLGRLQRISIEDMDAQHDAWLRTQVEETNAATAEDHRRHHGHHSPPASPSSAALRATVAVTPGDGLADVFRSLGVGAVVAGGQTMNPSAQELLAAARRTGAREVILLPNNGNVVMTARQAAQIAGGGDLQLFVVPTRTVPQGIAAQLAFVPDAPVDETLPSMEEAAAGVRTVEVTRATRAVTLNGVHVKAGDALGLLDDKLVVATADPLETAQQALTQAGAASAELITIYRGKGVPEDDGQTLAEAIRARYGRAEVEVVDGGQPHYDYLISVE